MRELGLLETVGVAIIGAGHLGQALAGYGGFLDRGFSVTGCTTSIRTRSGGAFMASRSSTSTTMDDDARSGLFAIAIIATPAEHAPEVLERLGEAGVRSILNFAPAVLRPPSAVEVRNVDLSTELQILSFYRTHRSGV